MEEMSKKTKMLEKENGKLTKKHDAVRKNIIAMAGERPVGNIGWDYQNKVTGVEVHLDYRRLGIASQLWGHARSINPDLQHHTDRSDAGDARVPAPHET